LILGMRSPDFFVPRHGPEEQNRIKVVADGSLPEAELANDLPAANNNVTSLVANSYSRNWETLKIRSGENLSIIFDRLHASRKDLDNIMSLGEPATALKYLMPGHELRVNHADGELLALEYDISLTDTIRVSKQNAVFHAETVTTELETRVKQASGIITDSLFLSAQRFGLSDNLTMQLVELFGWDIDFALDIREGDRFFILYEEKFKNGKKVQNGPILAAEFVNQDTPFHAVRYKTSDGHTGYFDEEGFSMRKAFLRTPVKFSRISSVFSKARRHPILNKIRAHKGVDYAAPMGTPVKSTSDGIISFAGYNGGYGKMLILRHGEKYSTAYGHLSRFASRMTVGKRIQQGQTIGYVGTTGLATGPHLHYEFRINGVHHNPLTVSLPKAVGIQRNEMGDFKAHTRSLLAQLEAAKTELTQQAYDNGKSMVALIKNPEALRVAE